MRIWWLFNVGFVPEAKLQDLRVLSHASLSDAESKGVRARGTIRWREGERDERSNCARNDKE